MPTTDLTAWTFWWEFNKDPILNLKNHIGDGGPVSDIVGFQLGRGQKRFDIGTMRPSQAQIRSTVVPALLRALQLEKKNADIITACLIALAKIGDPVDENGTSRFDELMLGYLPSRVKEVSETATIALGILANPDSRAYLVDLLADNEQGRKLVQDGQVPYQTRAFAAYGLGLIGARTPDPTVRGEIVRTLVNTMESYDQSDRDVKVACVIALGLVPIPVIDPPSNLSEDSITPDTCRSAQVQYLVDCLQNEKLHELIRAHAPGAICRLLEGLPDELYEQAKADIVEILQGRLQKKTRDRDEVVQSAVLAFGLLGDDDADDCDVAIRKTLANVPKLVPDQQARRFALISMARAASRTGRGPGAGEGQKEARKHLLGMLNARQVELRPWAGIALGILGGRLNELDSDPTIVGELGIALRAALDDTKNAHVQAGIALGIGIMGDVDARHRLLELLDNTKDEEARGYIALALGLLGDRDAVEPIERILERSKYSPLLLQQAAIALGLLGDKDVVPRLIAMLEKSSSLASQAAISNALGFIGDKRSVDPLVELLEDDKVTPLARAFAAVALGIVADKEDLPWNAKISVDLNYRASTVTLNDVETSRGVLNIL